MSVADQLLTRLWPDADLSPIERRVLGYLIASQGRVVPRDELLQEVWGYSARVKTHTVQTTVQRIRKKIEEDPARPVYLVTQRGHGYLVKLPGSAVGMPSSVVSRKELEQRLREWLGDEQDWVTLITPHERTTNLGTETDGFVGRRADLDVLQARLASRTRLITLLGAAGLGKTRLARELARAVQDAFDGGAWFCDLSDYRTKSEVLSAVADMLGLLRTGTRTPVAELLHQALLARGGTLLVLDNCEQLSNEAVLAIQHLVETTPCVDVVTTSRRRLGLPLSGCIGSSHWRTMTP